MKMKQPWRSIVVVIAGLAGLGCSGVNGDAGNIRHPTDPGGDPVDATATIRVAAATSNPPAGASYTVTISNGQKQTIDPNGSVSFTTKRTGTHEVALSSVPAECSLAGPNPVVVNLHAYQQVTVSF